MNVEPMLLTEIYDKSILDDTTKLFQIKENGVRALVHIKANKIVGIRNRSNLPILFMFPEFQKLTFPFEQAILDCEVCVFKEGKSVFYGGIDKRRSAPTAKTILDYPATLVVFDALFIDGSLVSKPYRERHQIITQKVPESSMVKVAKNFNGRELWQEVVAKNLEGVVIKNPNTPYEIGKRSKEQLKLKNYKIKKMIVLKTEPNSKGTKIFGELIIDGRKIDVEAQLAGIFDVETNSTQYIKFLDVWGNRLILPTKVNREQLEAY